MTRSAWSVAENDDGALPFTIALDRKQPVGDQVYEALKDAIVSVRLPPGTAISENRICRHVGASRTPIRSAIIRLVEDGLIDVYPQQGSFVAPIRLSTIKDSHFVRKTLELAVLAEATKVWTPALTDRARAIVERQRQAAAQGDFDRFNREDEEFHCHFALVAGLAGVWGAIVGAKARLDRLHRMAAIEGRMSVVLVEHHAVLDAMEAGDGREAAARLAYHLDQILGLLDTLRERHRAYFAD